MSDEMYYILYWCGIATGLSGLMQSVTDYQPIIGTPTTFAAVSIFLLALSAFGLGVTVRDMLPSSASGETK